MEQRSGSETTSPSGGSKHRDETEGAAGRVHHRRYRRLLLFFGLAGITIGRMGHDLSPISGVLDQRSVAFKPSSVECYDPGDIKTDDKNAAVPPSKMKVHYYEMWDHTTSTIVVPKENKNPFGIFVDDDENCARGQKRPARSSLEILNEILHGEKYQKEFDAVDAYIAKNATVVPSCLRADVESTRKLADRIVQKRKEKREPQRQRTKLRLTTAETKQNSLLEKKLLMPLPYFNVGFPKAGSNSLNDYFSCLGLMSNHGQQGSNFFERFGEYNTTSKKHEYGNILTQLDENIGPGFYPQISLLDELHEWKPNSTLFLIFRPVLDWIHSTQNWRGMAGRMEKFLIPGLVMNPSLVARNKELVPVFYKKRKATRQRRQKRKQLAKQLQRASGGVRARRYLERDDALSLSNRDRARWVCGHAMHIREYVKEYPSHALVELDLYDTDGTKKVLDDLFGADTVGVDDDPGDAPSCWGQSNKNKDRPN